MTNLTSLAANMARFTFKFQFGEYADPNPFAVYSFTGREEVNRPFEFVIELVSRRADIDITGRLGTPALLTIRDRSGKERLVHGRVAAMEQLHSAGTFTHYRLKLVPRLWFLGEMRDHRIWQKMSVVEIIQKILNEQGFAAEFQAFKLFYSYEPREYCVQYGETLLHFITRLCEEEGIYFYFEHATTHHCLTFSDREGGPRIEESNLRYFPGSGQVPDTAVISAVNFCHRVNANAATYREWNFTRPLVDLETHKFEAGHDPAPAPKGMMMEQYRFPHLYGSQKDGERYADLQLKRQLTFRQWIEVKSDVARYLPGYSFEINAHPRDEVNVMWWAVTVDHSGEQPGVLEHEAPAGRGLTYESQVAAIPFWTRFVPEIRHRKNRVEGLQSAIVTGPEGEEVFCDEYGRVKVQFHWDRLGNNDEKTTCWVRVADTWAGNSFGSIMIPRIGQEVMVEYMEGDPDRPVITGRVYNALNMPPWNLPGQKTLAGIQSREFKGGQRNQLVFDDTQNQIQNQLRSDYGATELNSGHINRINHTEGRKEFRGEGYELRTDLFGMLRAGKGMVLTTDERSKASSHVMDIAEATAALAAAASQHASQAELAVNHKAQTEGTHKKPVDKALEKQNKELQGSGQPREEMTKPHLLLSGKAGIAATTPESTHLNSGKTTALTAGDNLSLATAQSLLATALESINLFAHAHGIKMYAAAGKVDIQAQSDDLDIIADKVIQIISAKEKIHLSAPKEVLFTVEDSYMDIKQGNIEFGTTGDFTVHAAKHTFIGPKSKQHLTPVLPVIEGLVLYDRYFVLIDQETGQPIANQRYRIVTEQQKIVEGITDSSGFTRLIATGKNQEMLDVHLI
jgi:type VI secretion system secreted protein VgrG